MMTEQEMQIAALLKVNEMLTLRSAHFQQQAERLAAELQNQLQDAEYPAPEEGPGHPAIKVTRPAPDEEPCPFDKFK